MNMRRQLTVRFVLQLGLAGAAVLLITAATLIIVLFKLDEVKFSREFAAAGLERLVETSKLDKNGIRFDSKLLKQVKQNNGWLQTIDQQGQVESSYNTPSDVPLSYKPGELIDYWIGQRAFPYHLSLWIEVKHEKVYTIVYGAPNVIEPMLEELDEVEVSAPGEPLTLPASLASRIEQSQGFVQILDSNGDEVGSYARPNAIPIHYTVQDLALRTMYTDRYGYLLRTSFDEATGYTRLAAIPYGGAAAVGLEPLLTAQTRIIVVGVIALFASLLLLFLLLSLWQAHRFGVPMLHMLSWLDSLGRSNFKEPADRKGVPRSRTAAGKWRGRYRVFADVLLSINKLSDALRREQTLRQQTESMREEWIAGITHDLRTPLSSISGYAHLLQEPSYEWSRQEVRRFSATMLDKAAHMDILISDLAMTYRLKNGIYESELSVIEWNDWLREALSRAASNPAYGPGRVRFVASGHEIRRSVNTPWLERVVNNLTANALLHNPPETKLTVTLEAAESGKGLAVIFSDDGGGMDEATQQRLFERYYRGTDTSVSESGSGLGMAISKGLVEAMGGNIHVRSELGSGTVIRISWP
jgi:two-component system OmpR family sensor kinase